MALVALVSAKGAPGVTTLTVALAALTPGAVAADLDPDGGDLALRYRGEDGVPLDVDKGLLSLAASLRRDPNDFAGSGPIDSHLQVAAGGLEVLLGVKGPDQAIGLGPLWSPLARALTEADRMVFADCGRIGPASPAMPVLMLADAVIMVARAELEELAHLRERLRFLVANLPSRYSGRARVGVILVAPERDRAAGPRTEQLLRASGVPVSVLGTIADDERGAARLRGLGNGRAGRTTLVRSVRSLLPAVRVLAGDVPEVSRLRTGSRPGVLSENPQARNPQPVNPQLGNPQLSNPQLGNPQLGPVARPSVPNAQLGPIPDARLRPDRAIPDLPPPLLEHRPEEHREPVERVERVPIEMPNWVDHEQPLEPRTLDPEPEWQPVEWPSAPWSPPESEAEPAEPELAEAELMETEPVEAEVVEADPGQDDLVEDDVVEDDVVEGELVEWSPDEPEPKPDELELDELRLDEPEPQLDAPEEIRLTDRPRTAADPYRPLHRDEFGALGEIPATVPQNGGD